MFLTDNLKNINIPNLENKLISRINLFLIIFRTLNCENVYSFNKTRNRKMILITCLEHTFPIYIPMAHGNIFSSDILNLISTRQILTPRQLIITTIH